MAKPTPGELQDVDVQFVSLVANGANGRKFKLFKSADWDGEETPQEAVEAAELAKGNEATPKPENIDTEARADSDEAAKSGPDGFHRLFDMLKKFFTGEGSEAVEKATEPRDFAETMAQEDARSSLWRSFDVARDIVNEILNDDYADAVKVRYITHTMNSLKNYVTTRIEEAGIAKSAEEIAGPAEAAESHSEPAAEDSQEASGESASENDENTERGDADETAQALLNRLEGTLKATMETIAGRMDELESRISKQAEDAAAAVEELGTRLGVVEKSRNLSHSVIDETVEKRRQGTFEGAIFGRRS